MRRDPESLLMTPDTRRLDHAVAAEGFAALRAVLWRPDVLLLLIVLIYYALLPATNDDLRLHVFRWYDYILRHGRFHALADGFANYTPPYLYLLVLCSYVGGASPHLFVKLISIVSAILLALAGYRLLRLWLPRAEARLAAAAIMLIPSVAMNAAAWGQIDSLYAAAVLFGLAEALRNRWMGATVALGIGLSLKLQTVFVAPLFIYLALRRRIPWWSLPIPLITYAVMMVPAWLAGRSARDLALAYVVQGEYYHELSKAAPNMWEYIEGLGLMSYDFGVKFGMILACVGIILIVRKAWAAGVGSRDGLLLIALTSTITMPYLLPKMHNRYFFLADVLSYVYLIVRPSRRAACIALGVQTGSMLSGLRFLIKIPAGTPIGAVFVTAALILIFRELRDYREMDDDDHRLPRVRAAISAQPVPISHPPSTSLNQ